MHYNLDYIDLKYTLISCFLFNADASVLDISYSIVGQKIAIQVVLLEGCTLSKERTSNLKNRLSNYRVEITELCLTKEQFNENKGEWEPKHYKWLDYLLFSKAEEL